MDTRPEADAEHERGEQGDADGRERERVRRPRPPEDRRAARVDAPCLDRGWAVARALTATVSTVAAEATGALARSTRRPSPMARRVAAGRGSGWIASARRRRPSASRGPGRVDDRVVDRADGACRLTAVIVPQPGPRDDLSGVVP